MQARPSIGALPPMKLIPSLPPRPGQHQRIGKLTGASDALALAQSAKEYRPLVIITETAWDAQRLREEISYFAPRIEALLLPDWETLPYDIFSPHQDLVSERLSTLYRLMQGRCDVLITAAATALYRLPPVAFLAAHAFHLQKGQKLDDGALRRQLTLAGYHHVQQVLGAGEYCVRGGLIDLFPSGSALPYRLDLFDDEIETIRAFDADTQRSIYPVNEIRLLPAREFPLNTDAISRFRRNFRAQFEGDPSKSRLYKDISQGLAPAGIEYYLPLFFDQTATLFDYLPPDATLCFHHAVRNAVHHFWEETLSRYRLLAGDHDRPPLPPTELFLPVDAFFAAAKPYPRIELIAPSEENGKSWAADTRTPPSLEVDRRAADPWAKLRHFLDTFAGRTLLLTEGPGRRETMQQTLREYRLQSVPCEGFEDFLTADKPFMLGVAPLSGGFILPGERLAIITERELYAQEARQPRQREGRRRSASEYMLRDLSEIKIGDPVVHEQHGIGRYQGLVNLDLGEGATEFLALEYAGADKLYVPVSQLHLISRYYGTAPETAPLHKLGSGQWEKARRRALKQVRDTAAELLHLYALRAARNGRAFPLSSHDYEAFAAGFGFEETPDQATAIAAVIQDMRAPHAMDRLVCGDVGFGKTEVALRAAFIAVAAGTQVAVLVPTTLLAEQHFQTFSDRFADWPVRIAELSRFRSAKEQKATLADLAAGKIDIIIGTHRLLQGDTRFNNLGLAIIDEEHRFGVRQKERLKSLRAEVDILTLTATPIPRTLAMAMEGLREFSVIATAPQRRLAIKTFVSGYSEGVIHEAALRELKRGGQVYFLHNMVETIGAMREKLEKLLPEARIAIAHGQMPERELERVMRDFYQQRFNLLLCTTIIETGIDIPSANTIIINRADRFGLAQLHQLRGRVGRSHHQAYAYLLTPEAEALTSQAKKRLEAIQMLEDLGAGFYLAMHDLEIRGAGEVLGESQSGEMQEVGFNLYTEMLDAAVQSLKNGKEPSMDALEPLHVTTEINLHAPALLPDDYCGDINERLQLYKRMAHCVSLEELDAIHEELIDRFGLPPQSAKLLLDSHRLRLLAQPLGILRIDADASAVQLHFEPQPAIDPGKIIHLIQHQPNYQLNGPDRLKVSLELPTIEARVNAVQSLVKELAA